MASVTLTLRNSATSLLQPVTRLTRRYNSLISTVFNDLPRAPYPSPRIFLASGFHTTGTRTATPDESLLRVIEMEIRCAKETDDHDRVEKPPSGFPFQIEENPGLQTITLTREYQGEDVRVEVCMPSLVTGESDSDANDGDDDVEKPSQSSVPIIVTLSKKTGPSLEFRCAAFPDEVVIKEMAVRYPSNSLEQNCLYDGPDFRDLDEHLRKAFRRYLEIRGIRPKTLNFLHEYMINKDSRESMLWLTNLKKFIEA